MAAQSPRTGSGELVRVRGADLARAAFASSVLLVLATLLAWAPLANAEGSPVANWVILWGFAGISVVGAVSTLRSWRPGIYVAFGVAIGWVLIAISGLFYVAAILFSGTPVRGFSSEFLRLDVVGPTLVLICFEWHGHLADHQTAVCSGNGSMRFSVSIAMRQ